MAFIYGERLLIVVLLAAVTATAFVPRNVAPSAPATTTATGFRRMMVAKELSSNNQVESESFDFDDEEDDEDFEEDDDDEEPSAEIGTSDRLTSSRWSSLNPAVKERIIQKGQERAIANKKKREPDQDKKRRECLSSCLLTFPFLFYFGHVLTSSLSFLCACRHANVHEEKVARQEIGCSRAATSIVQGQNTLGSIDPRNGNKGYRYFSHIFWLLR
jgi:hypothetical protein